MRGMDFNGIRDLGPIDFVNHAIPFVSRLFKIERFYLESTTDPFAPNERVSGPQFTMKIFR
jgi:hypothetical protein